MSTTTEAARQGLIYGYASVDLYRILHDFAGCPRGCAPHAITWRVLDFADHRAIGGDQLPVRQQVGLIGAHKPGRRQVQPVAIREGRSDADQVESGRSRVGQVRHRLLGERRRCNRPDAPHQPNC